MHSMINSCVFYTQYVKSVSSVPCLPTRLPLYFFWIARNGLLIYSHHLFFIHFKVIFILKPGSSFYNKIQSDHKFYPHHLLEKFHFFLRFLHKSQSFEHSQQALTWSGPLCVSSLTHESTLEYSHFFFLNFAKYFPWLPPPHFWVTHNPHLF